MPRCCEGQAGSSKVALRPIAGNRRGLRLPTRVRHVRCLHHGDRRPSSPVTRVRCHLGRMPTSRIGPLRHMALRLSGPMQLLAPPGTKLNVFTYGTERSSTSAMASAPLSTNLRTSRCSSSQVVMGTCQQQGVTLGGQFVLQRFCGARKVTVR